MAPAFKSRSILTTQPVLLPAEQLQTEDWPPSYPRRCWARRLSGSRGPRKLPSLGFICSSQGAACTRLHDREEQGLPGPMLEGQAEGGPGRGAWKLQPGPVQSNAGLPFAFNQMFALEKEREIQAHWCGTQGPSQGYLVPPLPSHSRPHRPSCL